MRYLFILYSLLLFISPLSAQQNRDIPRPKLVVGIVIDQMRWDYLYRYYSRYGDDGFKRLMVQGFNCQNTQINYLPSFTGPGHACVYTGSVPSIHGIASNDWLDNATGRAWYCTEDTTVQPVGGSYRAGRMSPRNLLATTITDELKLATNMRSKVFGISIKDRGSILPAGHLANGAFWFDDSTGNFMSSSFYGNSLPGWVSKFNSKRFADSLLAQPWELMYPAGSYTQSLPDNNKYEGALKGETAPVFPHSGKGYDGYYGLRYMPGGNTIIFKMARICIREERLGQSGNTDFLCLSLSTPDYNGHRFTSNSMEAEDMFLRLDKELGSFLKYLDKNIGEGNYTIFLTADHGAAHNPNYMQEVKVHAGFMWEHPLQDSLNIYLEGGFKVKEIVKQLSDYQVYLNEAKITASKFGRDDIKAVIIAWLKQQQGMAYVIDMEDMDEASVPEPIRTMALNGYNRKRSGCIQLIPEPGWYAGYSTTGTTHGTWNPYDTHIPLLWYGWGIPKGETYRTVHMTDIAATLAALLHVQMPSGCVGEVIEEVLNHDE